MGQPAIVELYDNRLMPLASRDYTFEYEVPKECDGLQIISKVRSLSNGTATLNVDG